MDLAKSVGDNDINLMLKVNFEGSVKREKVVNSDLGSDATLPTSTALQPYRFQ